VTRISGPVLERPRKAVAVLRQREDPELLLMGFVDAAVLCLVIMVETPNRTTAPPAPLQLGATVRQSAVFDTVVPPFRGIPE
jgi:hypothetical protein